MGVLLKHTSRKDNPCILLWGFRELGMCILFITYNTDYTQLIDIDFYFKTYSENIISLGLRYFISLGLFR